MAARAVKKVFFPKTRLFELAARSGGITRDDAVDGAMKSLEAMRGESDAEICKSIAAMEEIALAPANRTPFDQTRILAVQRYADQIVTLAGTFGYAALDAAARSLCDIADGLLRSGTCDQKPIVVHIQTLRLMAPGALTLSQEHCEKMLGELAKVTEHFNFGSLDVPPVQDDTDIIAAAAK